MHTLIFPKESSTSSWLIADIENRRAVGEIVASDASSLIAVDEILFQFIKVCSCDKGICSRCCCQIRYSEPNTISDETAVPVGVIKDTDFQKYEDSKCHPFFVSKYTTAEKIAGGTAHAFTLAVPFGIASAFKKKLWPGFNNSDEVCSVCNGAPGSEGCCPVLIQIDVKDQKGINVDHTSVL